MLGSFFTLMNEENLTDPVSNRRRHQRRQCDRCVSNVGGQTYPVIDWSQGGLQIVADSRQFSLNQEMDVTLKFKLLNDIVDVPHKARVVRKSRERVAFEFAPLTRQIRNAFQHVIEDYVTREFAESQPVS